MNLAKTYTNCAWNYSQLKDLGCPGRSGSHVTCSHLAQDTGTGRTRIAFIGDSITEGNKVGAYVSFPHKLQLKLGERYAITNLGVSGATMSVEGKAEGTTCLASYMTTPQWQVALEEEADIFFILLGTNDAKPVNWDSARYKRDYLTMIRNISATNPHSQIVIGIPPPVDEDGKYDISKSIMNEEVPLAIREVATEAGLAHEPVDLFPLFGGIESIDSALYLDGVHPSELGNEKIAMQLLKVFPPLIAATTAGPVFAKPYTNCAWNYWQLLDFSCPAHFASPVTCSHLAEETDASRTRITFIGDSITEAHNVSYDDSYPHKIQRKLGDSYAITNLGVSGSTMQKEGKAEGSCPASYRLTPQWRVALEKEAEIIFVLLGTNDAKPSNWDPARYKRDYLSMLKSISATHPHSEIIIGIPPPLLVDGAGGVAKSIMNEDVPLAIREVAREAGLAREPVDMFPAFGGVGNMDPALYLDGCHPNERGYEMMAMQLLDVFSPSSPTVSTTTSTSASPVDEDGDVLALLSRGEVVSASYLLVFQIVAIVLTGV